MNKWVARIGTRIATALQYDEEQKNVLIYGLLAIMQFVVVIGLIVLFSVWFGNPTASLLLCFSVSVLRIHAGGAHSSSLGLCSAMAVLVFVGIPIVFSMWPLHQAALWIHYAVYFIVMAWAGYTMIKKAPVAHPNKPIVSEVRRRKLKIKSLVIVCMYVVLGTGFIHLEQPLYALLIAFGVLWQTFTMWPVGDSALQVIDRLLQKKA